MPVRYAPPAESVADATFTHTQISGGGGVRLHVVDGGNHAGRPIVFIHGFSQSWLSWSRQMRSELANEFRLVALDLRGHGESDKPHDGYSDCLLWADDIDAVIRELGLQQPLLCGWSYGSLLILDYIRQYGENAIGGVAFVDALTKLGTEAALSVLTPELLALVPGLFATEVDESVRTVQGFLKLCFHQAPRSEDMCLMLGYNLAVPPHVRQALFSRSFDNDDLLPRIRKPTLVVHGAEDAVVKMAVVQQHKAGMPHAQVHIMSNAGHAPFWEDAERFNECLRQFCHTL
jgi:non-heme chloroperoxidase